MVRRRRRLQWRDERRQLQWGGGHGGDGVEREREPRKEIER